jgi:hypothetical protein
VQRAIRKYINEESGKIDSSMGEDYINQTFDMLDSEIEKAKKEEIERARKNKLKEWKQFEKMNYKQRNKKKSGKKRKEGRRWYERKGRNKRV